MRRGGGGDDGDGGLQLSMDQFDLQELMGLLDDLSRLL
jgi:hypothetical protein